MTLNKHSELMISDFDAIEPNGDAPMDSPIYPDRYELYKASKNTYVLTHYSMSQFNRLHDDVPLESESSSTLLAAIQDLKREGYGNGDLSGMIWHDLA